MINLSSVITNPAFRTSFTIIRKTTGTWIKGRFVEGEISIPMSGIITVCKGKTLEQIPEADRTVGMMNIFTLQPIYVTRDSVEGEQTSDEVSWHGNTYKIITVNDDSSYGFYRGIMSLL